MDCTGECLFDGRGDGSCDDGTGYYGDFDCEELDWDLGDCLALGDACTMEDGSDGIYDCDMACAADTRGDESCDDAFDCSAADYDDGDCTAPEPAPGVDCTTESGEEGVYDCDMDCSAYPDWIGDDYCDSIFECAEAGWDGGDCDPGPGAWCAMEDASDGILGCDATTCVADTVGDATCDADLDCSELDFDDGDCAAPEVGSDCETTDYYGETVPGIVDCDTECSSYIGWIGDAYCDGIFDCEGTDWDGGDCI
jgi:hypothetical protein